MFSVQLHYMTQRKKRKKTAGEYSSKTSLEVKGAVQHRGNKLTVMWCSDSFKSINSARSRVRTRIVLLKFNGIFEFESTTRFGINLEHLLSNLEDYRMRIRQTKRRKQAPGCPKVETRGFGKSPIDSDSWALKTFSRV